MADRITAEQLDLLAETDPLRLRDEAIGLLTEIDRLRSELAEVRTGKVEQMLGRLGDWGEIGEYVRKIEAQRARYRLAWQSARRGRAEARAEIEALKETVAAADADRDRLERDVTFLTEIVVGTVLLGADDAIGMVRALTEHVAASGKLSADQMERVTAGLDKQQADRDRLAEQLETESAAQALHLEARDRLAADLDRLTGALRTLAARCEQGARDNGEVYERTTAKYEQGKATVWDAVATELRALLDALTERPPGT